MILRGTADQLYQDVQRLCPNIPQFPNVRREMLDYQIAALYALARDYNFLGSLILEIGTGHGASGYMLAKAAPLAKVISLTVNPEEAREAQTLWTQSGCLNITPIVKKSWEYLLAVPALEFVMVFVDGDHNHIALDLPWFNRLAVHGLFLCHDYSPEGSRVPSPIVYAELNRLAERLGRPSDVSLIDDGRVGMVGFYRREGETA